MPGLLFLYFLRFFGGSAVFSVFWEGKGDLGQKKSAAAFFAAAGFGAVSRNRTGDLVLTKDVLYRLSHNSECCCQRGLL